MSDWRAGTGQKIKRLYAWVSEEPDGGEGVIAVSAPNFLGGSAPVMMPLIGADRERVESFRSHAEAVHEQTGRRVMLKVFGGGTVLDTIG